MKTKPLPTALIIPLKSIPTIMVGNDPRASEIPRNKAATILNASRVSRKAHRIDGKLSKTKTYAVAYFATSATIRIS